MHRKTLRGFASGISQAAPISHEGVKHWATGSVPSLETLADIVANSKPGEMPFDFALEVLQAAFPGLCITSRAGTR